MTFCARKILGSSTFNVFKALDRSALAWWQN
jgi:hypothetical protein